MAEPTSSRCQAAGCIDPRTLAADGSAAAREAVPDTDLCPQHHHRFALILGDLVNEWPTLVQSVLRAPSKELRQRVQTSETPDTSTLWNPAATDAINELEDWTGFLVRTIVREREIPAGSNLGLTVETPTRLALAAIRLHHAYWLSCYRGLGADLLRSAVENRAQMLKAIDTSPSRRITLEARCNEIAEETEFGPIYCDGQLYGLLRTGEAGRPTMILCGNNPRHRITKPAGGWLDAL